MILRLLTLVAVAAALPSFAAAQGSSSASSEISSSVEPAVPTFSDAELERAVRAAYSGAAAFAAAHGNYFTRYDDFPPLRDAVRAEVLQEGLAAFAVPEAPLKSIEAAKACLTAPGAEVRIVPTTFGDGIGLVAVTDTRVFTYAYDPHDSAEVKVTPASECSAAR